MRHLVVRAEFRLGGRLYALEMLQTDDRILEETSRTSHHRRLRELLLTDLDDDFPDQRRSQRFLHALRSVEMTVRSMSILAVHRAGSRSSSLNDRITKMTIVQSWLRFAAESKHNVGDNVTSLDLRILEDRITVTIATLLYPEAHKLFLHSVIAIHLTDNILYLNTIRAYVLNSRRSHFPWNV